MIRRFLTALLLVTLIIAVTLGVTLKLRYGGGGDFPDRTGPPSMPADALELVAELDMPPGNIAVAADGRVFATLHPEARPQRKVVEIVDGQAKAWPDASWQSIETNSQAFQNVLSIRIDRQGNLWALDNGHHGFNAPRLIRFDLDTGKPTKVISFARAQAGLGSHYNDFQVSPDGQTVYIADASFFAKTPAIVVVDVRSGEARRVLEGHPSVEADHFTPVVQGRRMEIFGLVSIRPGVDSIALDRSGEWLYFAPVTDLHLHRVRTADLRQESMSPAELAGRVEVYADKTMSDGITTDNAGNIYLSDLEHSAIVQLRPDGTLDTLVADKRLRWPDGFSFGPGGELYVSCSALHQVIGRLPDQIKDAAPFQIYRLKTGSTAPAGH